MKASARSGPAEISRKQPMICSTFAFCLESLAKTCLCVSSQSNFFEMFKYEFCKVGLACLLGLCKKHKPRRRSRSLVSPVPGASDESLRGGKIPFWKRGGNSRRMRLSFCPYLFDIKWKSALADTERSQSQTPWTVWKKGSWVLLGVFLNQLVGEGVDSFHSHLPGPETGRVGGNHWPTGVNWGRLGSTCWFLSRRTASRAGQYD